MDSNAPVMGVDKGRLFKDNKLKQVSKNIIQGSKDYWSHHKVEFIIPSPKQVPNNYKGYMCPAVLSLHHPAEGKLLQFAAKGCATIIGKPWTLNQMEEETY